MMLADDDIQNLMDVDLGETTSQDKENDFFRLKRKLPYGLSKVAQQASNVARSVVRSSKVKAISSSTDPEKSLFHIGAMTKESFVRTHRHAEQRLLRALNSKGTTCHACSAKFSILKPRHPCTVCLHEFCGMCATHYNKEIATTWLCLTCRRQQAQQLAALSPPRSPRAPKAPCEAAINALLPDDACDPLEFVSSSPTKASPNQDKEFNLTDIFTDDIAQQFYLIDFGSPPVKKSFSAFPTPVIDNPFSDSPFALMPAHTPEQTPLQNEVQITEEELLQSYENAMREFLALSIDQPMSSIFDALQKVSDSHHPIVVADKQTMTPTPDKVMNTPVSRQSRCSDKPEADTPMLYMKPIALFRYEEGAIPASTPIRSSIRTPLQAKSSAKRVTFGSDLKTSAPSTAPISPAVFNTTSAAASPLATDIMQMQPSIFLSVQKAPIQDTNLSSTPRMEPTLIDTSMIPITVHDQMLANAVDTANCTCDDGEEINTIENQLDATIENDDAVSIDEYDDENFVASTNATFTVPLSNIESETADGNSSTLSLLRRPIYALLYLAIFASAYYASRLIFSSYATPHVVTTVAPSLPQLDTPTVVDEMQQAESCTEVVEELQPRKKKTIVLQPTIIHRRQSRRKRSSNKQTPTFEVPTFDYSSYVASTQSVIAAVWRADLKQRVITWVMRPMHFLRRAWTGQC